jgi:hypothetical protein
VRNPGEDPSPTATTPGQGPNSNIRFALDETNVFLSLASQAPSRRALERSSFLGTCVDTGAEESVAEARQYAAFARSACNSPTNSSRTAERSSLKARGRFSFQPKSESTPAFFDFDAYILNLDCPVLLGLDVLILNGFR